MHLLCLGDSYTIGESVAAADGWPAQLTARLRDQHIAIQDPVIIAKTGWTTDELSSAIDEANISGPFDLVTLMVGVNNQYRGRSVDDYRQQFHALLTRAIGFAGGNPGRVIVLSIPDWGVTPYAEGRDRERLAREIDRFNAVNREVARQAGARYVDITPMSRAAAEDARLTAHDGLHPSAEMYRRWVTLLLAEVNAVT